MDLSQVLITFLYYTLLVFSELLSSVKAQSFYKCFEVTTDIKFSFGLLNYNSRGSWTNQECSWEFTLPNENQDYVFLMQIPRLKRTSPSHETKLPNDETLDFDINPYYISSRGDDTYKNFCRIYYNQRSNSAPTDCNVDLIKSYCNETPIALEEWPPNIVTYYRGNYYGMSLAVIYMYVPCRQKDKTSMKDVPDAASRNDAAPRNDGGSRINAAVASLSVFLTLSLLLISVLLGYIYKQRKQQQENAPILYRKEQPKSDGQPAGTYEEIVTNNKHCPTSSSGTEEKEVVQNALYHSY